MSTVYSFQRNFRARLQFFVAAWWFPTLCTLALATTTSLFANPVSAKDLFPGSDEMAGEWRGAYVVYPSFVQFTLNLSKEGSGGSFEGTIRVEPLDSNQRSVFGVPTGVTGITATWNANTGVLEIVPGPTAKRDLGGAGAYVLRGVYDPKTSAIGGQIGGIPNSRSTQSFVMSRPSNADKYFFKRLKLATEDARSSRFRKNVQKEVLKWAERLIIEYPEEDFFRSSIERSADAGMPLFRDEYFKPAFKESFDLMSPSERTNVLISMSQIPPPRGNLPEERANGVARAMQEQFKPGAANPMIVNSIAMRYVEGWMAHSKKGVRALDPSLDGLTTVLALEAVSDDFGYVFFPSEREDNTQVFIAVRSSIAAPALSDSVDQMLSSVAGLEGAREIAKVLGPVSQSALVPSGTPTIPQLFALVNDSQAQEQRMRLENKQQELLENQVQADVSTIPRFSQNLEGLRSNTDTYATMQNKYGEFSRRAEFWPLAAAIVEQRESLLTASEASLIAQIESASTSSEIANIVSANVSVPGDSSTDSGGRIIGRAEQKRSILLGEERVAAERRAAEERLAASACAKASKVRSETGEPTGEEICRSLEAAIANAERNLAAMGRDCSTADLENSMAAAVCLGPLMNAATGGTQLSVGYFKKSGCDYGRYRGQSGYLCYYDVKLVSSNELTAVMFDVIPAVQSQGFIVPTSDGWIFNSL